MVSLCYEHQQKYIVDSMTLLLWPSFSWSLFVGGQCANNSRGEHQHSAWELHGNQRCRARWVQLSFLLHLAPLLTAYFSQRLRSGSSRRVKPTQWSWPRPSTTPTLRHSASPMTSSLSCGAPSRMQSRAGRRRRATTTFEWNWRKREKRTERALSLLWPH